MELKRPFSRTLSRLLKPLFLCVFLLAASFVAMGASTPSGVILVDNFSNAPGDGALPNGWKKLTFPRKKRHTSYTVDMDGGDRCLKAESHESASAIYKEMRIDLHQYQILSWKWKIRNTLKKGDAHTREGDDYPARIYAAFEFQPEKATAIERIKHRVLESIYNVAPPGNTITYIWSNRLPKNSTLPNAFSDRMIMVAVESGDEQAGRWLREERNLYEDYRRLFKEEPPMLRGVIVMTDSDNTHESTVAWYDDIVLKRKR
ncbi:MAG: DUF3047 domain-containing protein [Thermodesulfobacteriota bacterium]